MIHNSALKIIISLLLLLFSTKMFATEKKRLAVLDFSANNTSPTYARIIRNQIEVSLYRTNVFDILERNKMELILKEQEFETTGCIDTSCAIRIGKLLSVDYVALGSIDKMTAFTYHSTS